MNVQKTIFTKQELHQAFTEGLKHYTDNIQSLSKKENKNPEVIARFLFGEMLTWAVCEMNVSKILFGEAPESESEEKEEANDHE
jgi:hypothetical protein